MRRVFLLVLSFAIGLPLAASTRMEILNFLIKKDITKDMALQIEKDLRGLPGLSGVKWELPAHKLVVLADVSILCPEDVVRLVNVRSEDGRPIISDSSTPDYPVALSAFGEQLKVTEETYRSTGKIWDTFVHTVDLQVRMEDLANSVRKEYTEKGVPATRAQQDPRMARIQFLSQSVWVLEEVARRKMDSRGESALQEVRKAFEALLAESGGAKPASKK